MVSILRLIWGFLTGAGAAVMAAASAAVTGVVASRGMTVAVVGAAVAAIILALPMPAWLVALPGRVASLPPSVVWAMEFAELKTGLTIVLGCMVTKFVTRLVLRVVTS